VEIHDLTWELYEPTDESRRQKWQAEIEEKVREKYIPLVNQFGVGGYAGRYWGDNEPFPLVESKVAVVGAGSSRKKAR